MESFIEPYNGDSPHDSHLTNGLKSSGISDLESDPESRANILSVLPKKLIQLWEKDKPLGVIWVSIKAFSLFTKVFGDEASQMVLERLSRILESVGRQVISDCRFLIVERVDRGALGMMFQNGSLSLDMLNDRALSIKVTARHQLSQDVVQITGQNLYLDVGYGIINESREDRLGYQLFQTLNDAGQMAAGTLDPTRLPIMDEFRRLIEIPLLYSVYQPVVDLANGDIMGWEALARGPGEGHFASPKTMFDFAEEVGTLFQLERACRQQAVKDLGRTEHNQKLFLNIHPQTLGDPDFRAGETKGLLADHGLKPENVVFEITERHSIRDFTLFHRTLDHYRSQGFLVAIDDAGTGFSGLNRIAMLRPDFIKADMSLVRGASSNPVQRALLETLAIFADKIGCSVIGEGIENESDLSCLISTGVHYGQGFYLGRPSSPKSREIGTQIFRVPQPALRDWNWKCSIPIKSLVQPATHVQPEAEVKAVKALLDSKPMSGIVVVRDEYPVGLIMSHNLDRKLGTQYGIALYYNKCVESIMDSSPLVVDSATPIEFVAKESTRRERFKIYDHIVVTEKGKSIGVVSVQKMIDSLALIQVEMAKGSNPLTGLMGGLALETEVERRCGGGRGCSLVYVDLDNFKVYNDTYGFKAGDKMIMMTAEILLWAGRRHGGDDFFVGHIGGDDFVVIAEPGRAERLSLGVVRCFQRLVQKCYREEHREKGYVEAKGRDGKSGKFPLTSISLGIVNCAGESLNLQELAKRAAEIKKYAKSIPGCVYVKDRREPMGAEDDCEQV
jgi:diguanylate cyclase (GGDEF)-like protein